MARYFIGVMLPEEIKDYAEAVKSAINRLPMDCKFVERENLHICLSFLGEVEDAKIGTVSKILDTICSGISGFEFALGEILIIPSESYVRVLALEGLDDSGMVSSLMKKIGNEIGGDSHAPHLTLCRIKKIEDKASTVERIKSIPTEDRTFSVEEVYLIKSELGRNGPSYTVVHSSKLR